MNIHPKHALQKLDFPFILNELENLCAGTLGKNLIQQQSFIIDVDVLNNELHFVNESKEIIENDAQLPQFGFNELPFLNKLKIDNYYLTEKELVELYYALTAVAEVFRFFTPKARQQLYPFLSAKISNYNLELGLIQSISKIIDVDKEMVKENATPTLSKIRKEIHQQIQEINSVFRSVVNKHKQANFLMDTEETIRDGRRVLAVKAEYKRSIKGMIVDESENGNITFIEPNETVFLNNELVELYLDERKEIHKILIDLTSRIQPQKENIDALQTLMSELDVIRAKAYFAINYKCSMPEISKTPKIYLREFVHPILLHHHKKQNKPIIDNTILLDENDRVMVISGPNAGGKSIVLKSVGLIQLMFQFGMLIPAKANSTMSVFENLFVDIGDEQSIENDLSTYSSHLSNMNYFLQYANTKTLVLIDEMGMGTDPALGGAMAESILENLHQKKITGVITTHFNNLKIYAAQTENMQSAAMAFDTKNLKPLYQLQIGQPGSSFTFEIAKKSGLSENIIKNAVNKTGENKKALDDVLGDIQAEKQFIKGIRKNVQVKETQLQDLTKSYQQLNKELEKEKKRLLKQYEARLLDRFNDQSRNLENEMRIWKEAKNNKEKFLEVRNYIDDNRAQIEKKLDDTTSFSDDSKSSEKLKIGSKVKLEEGTEIGEIIDIKNNTATVTFGNMQTKVKLNNLILANEKTKTVSKQNQYSSKIILEKAEFDYNLDLRGLMKDEAIIALDNFMDKVIMYGMHKIKILHGRGTGAIKQVVQNYLKNYPHVKEYKYESDQFGGDGVTSVEMK